MYPTSATQGNSIPIRLILLNFIAVLYLCSGTSALLERSSFSPALFTLDGNQDAISANLVKDSVAGALASALRVFQVYPPVLTSTSNSNTGLANGAEIDPAAAVQTVPRCVHQRVLMKHEFANSYNKPFIGVYKPPKGCSFNRVTFNFTVTSRGRQFDRLAVAYFGDTEIWRTSTAEPTQNGIVWTYIKDMSPYLTLFKQQQKLIFDLGNLIDDTYTAPFDTVLTASFFTDEGTIQPADAIIPISARQASKNAPSAWQVPPQVAKSSLALLRNVKRAVVSVSATGQIDEEFWFGNVFSSQVDTFPQAGTLLGYSPFREIQLLIDGQLAGVVWPFPIIFTGGVVPGLWRPIVGIDSFDLREDEIDITPWLPVLCDGRDHEFSIVIAGISDDGKNHGKLKKSVGNYWVITGKVFIWLDKEGSITTGSQFVSDAPDPTIQLSSTLSQNSTGANETLNYSTKVSRELSISSTVKTASRSFLAVWKQSLQYTNRGDFSKFGLRQISTQSTNGSDYSSLGFQRHISYPVTVDTTYMFKPGGALSINATLSRAQYISIFGTPTFPTGLQSFEQLPTLQGKSPKFQGSILQTSQSGSAFYQSNANNSIATSYGQTTQDMTFTGARADSIQPEFRGSVELYRRHVKAVNSSIVEDSERLIGRPIGGFSINSMGPAALDFAGADPRRIIGKGPPL